jgi:hypothetical protein
MKLHFYSDTEIANELPENPPLSERKELFKMTLQRILNTQYKHLSILNVQVAQFNEDKNLFYLKLTHKALDTVKLQFEMLEKGISSFDGAEFVDRVKGSLVDLRKDLKH